MKHKHLIALCLVLAVSVCSCSTYSKKENESEISISDDAYKEQYEKACTTPFGKYPELVTYSLGKMTGANNSNMPEGDTYENNAYTRYLKGFLNIQNDNAFEVSDDDGYDDVLDMAIANNNLPDIMVVSDLKTLEKLVKLDMIEDLTDIYKNCASDKIKEIYNSYGDVIFNNVTFSDKLMALPETNIEDGPNLLWLRKDWMDKLGVEEPKTLEEALKIVKSFVECDPGENGEGNTVGLVCDANLTGDRGYSSEYQMDIVFANNNSYPKQWIYNSKGEVVYGSVQKEAKATLKKLHQMYEDNILDNQFLLRTTTNIIELIDQGECGSFFGPWWTPNNPLMQAMQKDPEADWQPYVISTDGTGTLSYHSQNPSYKYVAVRKGYEHPEIAAKIISTLFDYVRYEDKDANELVAYYQQNVDPSARPIAINIDYSDALSRCYENLTNALDGTKAPSELELLEYSYYQSCQSYLAATKKKEKVTAEDWAAYMSRINACSLINKANTKKVDSLFFGTTETMQSEWWQLEKMEKKAYLEIVTGVKPIEYFDEFVKEWNEKGGLTITKEVSKIVKKRVVSHP
ncbi:MAG: extracellular solute-binding protein [bacterium]|nr:extracellular solute-binding protein [bacterium]